LALDFDLACSYRLMEYDNQRELERFKAHREAVKQAISEAFMGTVRTDDSGPIFDDDDEL
jgi:hypothetical protein